MQLYLVKMRHPNTSETFFKLGVSTNVEARFKYGSVRISDSDLPLNEQLSRMFNGEKYVSDFPYEVNDVEVVDFTFEGDARIYELRLLETLKPIQYWPKVPFSGHSECFRRENGEEDFLPELVRQMKAAASDASAAEPSEWEYAAAGYLVDIADPIERHLQIMAKIKNSD